MKTSVLSDQLLGIETKGYIVLNNRFGYFNYEGTPYSMLSKLFEELSFAPDSCLVDIGCGLGRVTFSAAYCGCKHVIGVEVNKEIFPMLQDNYSSYANLNKKEFEKTKIELVNDDINSIQINNYMNIFFLFNPFHLKYFISTINRIRKSIEERDKNTPLFLYLYMPPDAYTKYLNTVSDFTHVKRVSIGDESSENVIYTDVYKSVFRSL